MKGGPRRRVWSKTARGHTDAEARLEALGTGIPAG
jgi:hypothetical protein